MYKHILIPTDGSDLSRQATRQGIELAKSTHARVTLMTASSPFHEMASEPIAISETPENYAARAGALAAERLKSGEEYARAQGVETTTEHVFADHPYEAIIAAAGRNRCDLVFMASHGRKGVAGLLIGSETQKVLTHSKIPVLVCR